MGREAYTRGVGSLAGVPAREPVKAALAVAVLAFVCGVALSIVISPLGGFDEPEHFVRAWQVSDGGIFPRKGVDSNGVTDLLAKVPGSLPDEMQAIMRDGLFNPHNRWDVYRRLGDPAPHGSSRFEGYEGAPYSPVAYLPSAVAIRVGRAFGLSTVALIELARLAQVIAYAAIIGLAVYRIRYRRLVLAVLALTPVALLQMGTISADPLTTALTLLVVAEASYLLTLSPAEIGIARICEAGAALVALALVKPPYFLVGALLLLPILRHRGRVAAGLTAAMATAAGLAIGWNQWANDRYVPQNGTSPKPGSSFYAFHDVAARDQFGFVRSHPFSFLGAIGRTLARYPGSLLHDTFAQSPSWRPPGALVVGVVALIAYAIVVSREPLPGGRAMRLLGLGVAAALFVSLMFLAYVGWNAVTAPRIDAVQGRYLLPVVAVLALVAIPAVNLGTRSEERALSSVLIGSGVLALWTIVGVVRLLYF
jgi:hypothetical protein